jgi:hypothetical protein
MIMMAISMGSLGVSTFFFKQVYQDYRQTIFEDIYGRGVVFFVCSVIHYLFNKSDVSLFDLKVQIRITFFFRVLFVSFAYVFTYLAILNTSSFVYVVLILCMLPPLAKVVQRQTMIERNFSVLDLISFVTACVGLGLLFTN